MMRQVPLTRHHPALTNGVSSRVDSRVAARGGSSAVRRVRVVLDCHLLLYEDEDVRVL